MRQLTANIVWVSIWLIVCIWVAVHQWRIIRTLKRSGIITNAEIIRVEKTPIFTPRLYFADYRFYVQSEDRKQLFEGQQIISLHHFYHLTPGQSVRIIYLPIKPHISKLAGNDADYTSRDAAILCAIIIVIVCGLLVLSQV